MLSQRLFRFGLIFIFLSSIGAPELALAQAANERSAAITRSASGQFPADEIARFIDVAQRIRAPTFTVVLNIDWIPEGYLDEAEVVIQRERIATAQQAVINKLTTRSQAPRVHRYHFIPMMEIAFDTSVLNTLSGTPEVRRVEVSAPVRPALNTTTVRTEAKTIWNHRGSTGAGQVVALLDTGVTPAHPALYGKVIGEACFSTHNPSAGQSSLCFGGGTSTEFSSATGSAVDCGAIADGCGHGTIMAGIIAANSATKKGMAPDAKIFAIQIFTNHDGEALARASDIADALEHVFTLRNTYNFAAVNLSVASLPEVYTSCESEHSSTTAAVEQLRSVGILTVAGAGNGGSSSGISWPACISDVVSVGAVATGSDTIWSGSNRHSIMDFWAPGDGLVGSTGQYGNDHGSCCTSAASAVMSGAIALLRSGYPGNPSAEVQLESLRTAGVVLSGAGLSKPRIALDLALPPSPLNVQSWYCFGQADVSWSSTPTANTYRLERRALGTSTWQFQYNGSNNLVFVNVPQSSVFRVRAQNGTRHGGFNSVSGVAIRYQYCM